MNPGDYKTEWLTYPRRPAVSAFEALPQEGRIMGNLLQLQTLGPLAGVAAMVGAGCWVAWEALRRG